MTPPSTTAGAMTLEICVESVAGAVAAIGGGCHRIELCSALALGGLTPSAGLVAAVLDVARPAGVPVRAMVRPRPGGFVYDRDDLALAVREARALVAAGVQGLVFGATRGGALDREALGHWLEGVEAAVPVTLHRAIDVTDDPVAGVDVAVELGFDCILTSGGATTAPDGTAVIARMVAAAAGRCSIMAGAGVSAGNARALVAATGVAALHGSASEAAEPAVLDRFGFGPPPRRTSETIVRALREAIDDKSNIGQL